MEGLEKGILRGWKEIEEYALMTRHSLISNGFPVRRERKGSVYALKAELDAWMRGAGQGRKKRGS